jgi:hypothetical protein
MQRTVAVQRRAGRESLRRRPQTTSAKTRRPVMRSLARLSLLLLSLLLAAASAVPAHGAPEAMVAPPVPPTPIIAAFYYPWYGGPPTDKSWVHWHGVSEGVTFRPPKDVSSDFYPTLGAYSVRSAAAVAQHMAWLKAAGVEVIIASWWGRGGFEDKAIPLLMQQAAAAGIQVAFHLEPYTGRSADSTVADVQYIYDRYGSSPAFFRSSRGSPYNAAGKGSGMFFLWNPGVQYNDGPPADAAYWRQAADSIHALPDGGLVIVQSTDSAWVSGGHFDGAYSYADLDTNPPDWGRRLPDGAWFIPSVLPGFSAQRVQYPATTTRDREGGVFFDRQWRSVIETGLTPPMITITSFNEWHEGTQIEPAASGADSGRGYSYPGYDLGPNQYLDAAAAWAAQARAVSAFACAQTLAIDLRTTNVSNGLYQRDLPDGLTESAAIGGRSARKAVSNGLALARYIYLLARQEFQFRSAGPVQVAVEYYDLGTGWLRIEYDSPDSRFPVNGAYKATESVPLTNSRQWRTAVFDLPDAFFGDRQNGGADLRILLPDIDFYASRVTVTKPQPPCGVPLYLPTVRR